MAEWDCEEEPFLPERSTQKAESGQTPALCFGLFLPHPAARLSFPSKCYTSALLSKSQGLSLQGALLTQKGQEIVGEQAEKGWSRVGECLV